MALGGKRPKLQMFVRSPRARTASSPQPAPPKEEREKTRVLLAMSPAVRRAPFVLLIVLLRVFQGAAAEPQAVPLRPVTNILHDVTLKELDSGTYEVRTIGTDPYLTTSALPQNFDIRALTVLSFDYICAGGIDHVQVFTLPPGDEQHSVKSHDLPAVGQWSTHAIDLQRVFEKTGRKLRSLRLDFGSKAGKTIQIRSLQLRAPTQQEQEIRTQRDVRREKENQLEAHLREYLEKEWPCAITHIKVEGGQIKVSGNIGTQKGDLFLVQVPMFANATELKEFPFVAPIRAEQNGEFSTSLDRFQRRDEREQDRLLARWAVVRKTGDGYQLLSSARYADDVQAKWDVPEEKPRTKKGLGGFWIGRPFQDLDDMNISSVTVNVSLNGFMRLSGETGQTGFSYAGKTWHVDDRAVAHLDQTLLEAAKRGIIVSAIILVNPIRASPDKAWAKLVAHPDADPAGIYVMPNVSDEAGLEAYAAALDFLAQRYSRPDRKYGRIHHWIMHNEVDAGWEWTNAGEKTALRYLELYHKSMRAMHLLARQYDPHAQVFISLTHYWTERANEHCYPSKTLLELLLRFSRSEGDFDWAIAYHPYPEDLRNPRVWADKTVNFTFNTPKITFKNIEVLDAWANRTNTWYLGQRRRAVHLTEQGLNSPDYSEKSLQEQAAGMAYAWKKIERLETIEVFDYHNWVDNRAEGGLRIGLRRFPDDQSDPLGKKPVWFVYQALGTETEDNACAFAKSVIGITNWDEIVFHGVVK